MKGNEPKVKGDEAMDDVAGNFSTSPVASITTPCKAPANVHAFGNKTRPRPPRIKGVNTTEGQKADITPNGDGNLEPPRPGEAPKGASVFGDPSKAPITGHYHKLPEGSELPEGLGIVADGSDVGGPHAPTHHTIYPTRVMSAQEFLDKFDQIPWVYAGKK